MVYFFSTLSVTTWPLAKVVRRMLMPFCGASIRTPSVVKYSTRFTSPLKVGLSMPVLTHEG